MKRRCILLVGCLLIIATINSHSSAQRGNTIKGTITDAATQKPLIGANVIISGTTTGAASDKDGRFTILNAPGGQQTIEVTYLGYFTGKKTVSISGDITVDFALRPRTIESPEVVVTATRARERQTPVAFTNVDREDIKERYDLQDIPMLLTDVRHLTVLVYTARAVSLHQQVQLEP